MPADDELYKKYDEPDENSDNTKESDEDGDKRDKAESDKENKVKSDKKFHASLLSNSVQQTVEEGKEKEASDKELSEEVEKSQQLQTQIATGLDRTQGLAMNKQQQRAVTIDTQLNRENAVMEQGKDKPVEVAGILKNDGVAKGSILDTVQPGRGQEQKPSILDKLNPAARKELSTIMADLKTLPKVGQPSLAVDQLVQKDASQGMGAPAA